MAGSLSFLLVAINLKFRVITRCILIARSPQERRVAAVRQAMYFPALKQTIFSSRLVLSFCYHLGKHCACCVSHLHIGYVGILNVRTEGRSFNPNSRLFF